MLPPVSQAWQSWKSARSAALVIVVAFTVGIGSATAIFTVIDSLLLRPIPYQHGDRFVSFLGASFDKPREMLALRIDDVLEYQRRARSFDVFGWFKFANYNLTAPGPPQYINGVEVTPPLVNSLGVNPRFRDTADGSVAVISDLNAGHNAPYLLRAGAASMAVEELSTGGTIIGMFPQALYEEGTLDMRPGDVLIVFTDGVTEALNPGDEEFGEERLKDLFRQVFHLPVEEMSSRISQELKSWIQDAAQYDDLTFLLMKMK